MRVERVAAIPGARTGLSWLSPPPSAVSRALVNIATETGVDGEVLSGAGAERFGALVDKAGRSLEQHLETADYGTGVSAIASYPH